MIAPTGLSVMLSLKPLDPIQPNFLKENEILEETYALSVQNMSSNINLVKTRNMCTIE